MGQPPACCPEEGTVAPVTFHTHGAIFLQAGGGWEDEFGSRGVWVDVNPVGAE